MPQNFVPTLLNSFPHARYYPDLRLITWHPTGVLTDERADQTVELLEAQEESDGVAFDRYTDMTGYTRIQLSFEHIVRLARRRRRYAGPPVKSALYAVRLISVQIARMYEELMERSKIEVCTFRDRAAVAEWLGVPLRVLQPPKKESS